MTRALSVSAEDRAWQLGAYALATLIHLPLILAAHEFAAAIAAARPVESVITLLDTPETERVRVVPTELGRADAVTQSADTLKAAPLAATRLGGTAATVSIAPAGTAGEATSPITETQSIASIIASDTLAPASEPSKAASPATATVAAKAVDAPASVAVQTTARPATSSAAVSPAEALSSTSPIAVVTTTARPSAAVSANPAPATPAELSTERALITAPAAASVAPSAVTAPLSTAVIASATAATAPPIAARSQEAPTVASVAQPRPRIAIAAPRPQSTQQTTAVAPVSGSTSGPSSGSSSPASVRAVSPSAVGTSSAQVVSAVSGISVTARSSGAVASPVVAAPIVARVGTSPAIAVPALLGTPVRPNPRTAALPPDEVGTAAARTALNSFMRGYEGGGCFAALTVETAGSGLAVSGFSRDETTLAGFANALKRRTGPRPTAAARQVSEAQCSVLAFARAQASYPDFPVRLSLTPERIPSGGTVSGRVTGVGDRPVTMLILDDEGRIQDASFLLARKPGGDWVFETPLSLTGDPVPTVQLFVALAGDGPLAVMRPPVPVEARRYFAEIDRLLKAKGQALDVALAAFTVDRQAGLATP